MTTVLPEIPPETLAEWQRVVDLTARLARVPASLIMRTERPTHPHVGGRSVRRSCARSREPAAAPAHPLSGSTAGVPLITTRDVLVYPDDQQQESDILDDVLGPSDSQQSGDLTSILSYMARHGQSEEVELNGMTVATGDLRDSIKQGEVRTPRFSQVQRQQELNASTIILRHGDTITSLCQPNTVLYRPFQLVTSRERYSGVHLVSFTIGHTNRHTRIPLPCL